MRRGLFTKACALQLISGVLSKGVAVVEDR